MEGCVVKDFEVIFRNSRKECSVRAGRVSINVSYLLFMYFDLMFRVVKGMEDLWGILFKVVFRLKLI